jgi:hypothetical protein
MILALLLPKLWLYWRSPAPACPIARSAGGGRIGAPLRRCVPFRVARLRGDRAAVRVVRGHTVSWYGIVTFPALIAAGYRPSVTLGY